MSSVRLGPVSLVKLLARRRRVAARNAWSRLTLDAHQRHELDELRNFAYTRSRFYGRFHDGKEHAQLPDLPVLTKTTLMEHWDGVVTDPSISLDRVLRFVEGLGAPALLDDRYFVTTTSGTTGLKGAFVYGRDEWISVLASYARANDWAGVPAGVTHRLRLAVVSTTAPWHQSAVVGASLKGPLVPTLRLDATSPMEEIVSALNDFQPESLVAYAAWPRRWPSNSSIVAFASILAA